MDITISSQRIKEFADQIDLNQLRFHTWNTSQFIITKDLDILAQYFFIGNAINFCFWCNRYDQRFKYKQFTGSAAMWAVMRDNPQYLDANYLESFTVEQEPYIMSMPMPYERQMALREAGKVLNKLYGGKVISLCIECEWDAITIIDKITLEFNMWSDECRSVRFDKRAKLFVAMLHGRLAQNSPITHINKLSCLADYQVPKVLEHFGILRYPSYIKEAISRQFIFSSGSNEEFQIRFQTIGAMQQMCDYINTKGNEICPLELDYYVWNLSRSIEGPHHLTFTKAY